jgi:geranylgeranyl diphosphate synthase type II
MVLKDYIKANSDIGIRVYEKFHDIAKAAIEGQFLDLDFSLKHNLDLINENVYYNIADKKSAYYSVYGPLQIGALISNQDGKIINLLKEIGKPVGIAAQIQDDLLDFYKYNEFGKEQHQDLREGKLTLIILHAYANSSIEDKGRIRSIFKKSPSEKTKENIDRLLRIIRNCNSINYARRQRNNLGKLAENVLVKNKALINKYYFSILKDAIRFEYSSHIKVGLWIYYLLLIIRQRVR